MDSRIYFNLSYMMYTLSILISLLVSLRAVACPNCAAGNPDFKYNETVTILAVFIALSIILMITIFYIAKKFKHK